MLRRAIAGHRYHPHLCPRWLSRPLPQACRSFSTSPLTLSSRWLGDDPPPQNPSSPLDTGTTSSTPEADDDTLPPASGATMTTTTDTNHHVLSSTDNNNATGGGGSGSAAQTTTRRTRTLRPLLIPPAFPQSILLPMTATTTTTMTSSQKQDNDNDAATSETERPATIIALAGLPPNTVKADIRPVFQRFGEVRRIVVHTGGRRADVVFADAHGVKRTLHAYAEQPLRVRGREAVVFRKHVGVGGEYEIGAGATSSTRQASSSSSYPEQSDDGAIFVSNFPAGMTQEELLEALAPLGKHQRFVMRPGSKYAYFVYSSDDRVEHILRVHQRVPITLRGRTLRIERTENRPYGFSPGLSGQQHSMELELGKPLDPATSSAVLDELKRTVPRWRGTCEPSRVLWIGRLPTDISRTALTNFWSRLGCVVEVRTSLNGFAHVEFASTEEALRAARQGAPHGFRYALRLLDVDFAPWLFYIGPAYRVVYITGWPASYGGRPALLQWAYDIPNIVGGTVLPPFRGENRSDPRGAFLQFRSIDDARAGLRRLDGRAGPSGEALSVGLSRLPAVHPNRLWRWGYAAAAEDEKGGEACFDDGEWAGLGFGTGREEEAEGDGVVVVSGARGDPRERSSSPIQVVGTRGGRRRGNGDRGRDRDRVPAGTEAEDVSFSHLLREAYARRGEDGHAPLSEHASSSTAQRARERNS